MSKTFGYSDQNVNILFQQWDSELARVAQKWADQCVDVDYQNDIKRKDPLLFHDAHAHRKIGTFYVKLRLQ